MTGKRSQSPKRRQNVEGGGGHNNAAKGDSGGDGPTAFEKDMMTLEAQQDIYFVLFASMLNISVLKSVQPLVAKKGLMVRSKRS